MNYEKTVWADGDIISAQRMNNIENGIAAAASAGEGGGTDSSPVVYFFLDDLVALAESQIDGLPVSTFTDVLQSGKSIVIIERDFEGSNNDYIVDSFYFLNSANTANYGAWSFRFINLSDIVGSSPIRIDSLALSFREIEANDGYINSISKITNSFSLTGTQSSSDEQYFYPSEPVPTV